VVVVVVEAEVEIEIEIEACFYSDWRGIGRTTWRDMNASGERVAESLSLRSVLEVVCCRRLGCMEFSVSSRRERERERERERDTASD
jgi:hypothetical protein